MIFVKCFFCEKKISNKENKFLATILMIIILIFFESNLIGCDTRKNKEPIVGEWEFDYLSDGNDIITSEMVTIQHLI